MYLVKKLNIILISIETGCLVWWFAPKCPLAKVFGVDPLKIYPWGKFCKIYSAFQDAEVCQDHIDINMPKMSKRSANE